MLAAEPKAPVGGFEDADTHLGDPAILAVGGNRRNEEKVESVRGGLKRPMKGFPRQDKGSFIFLWLSKPITKYKGTSHGEDDMVARGRKGGLTLLWPRNLNVTIMSYSSHHIEAMVEDDDEHPWCFVGFYGHHEVRFRTLSWELLKFLNNKLNLPTVFLGDFSEVLDVVEH
ncbi:hypothetical protein LIER_20501 [Lithospermum erythrorhizon]|uniref:Uncharacterized protein n=1 Tax=Lithospermum erythrorhizon TaxID=34254 RepID=A0AAV3QLN8_LITER